MPSPLDLSRADTRSPEFAAKARKMSLRELLASLIPDAPSLATNNSAAGGNMYAGAGLPEMSIGAGQAPTINQPGVSALAPDVVQRGQDAMLATLNSRPSVIGQMSSGTITPAAAPATPLSQPPATRRTPHHTPRRAVPAYDTAAMDQLMAAIADGTYEGPNIRIDDDTRARALAWALRNNPT